MAGDAAIMPAATMAAAHIFFIFMLCLLLYGSGGNHQSARKGEAGRPM